MNSRRNLLLRAASRLQNVHDHWESERASLDHALLFNRKLWTIFLTSVTNNDNPLPAELRQNIANLGIFVINQTLNVMGNPKPRAPAQPDQHQPPARGGTERQRLSDRNPGKEKARDFRGPFLFARPGDDQM